MKPPLAQTTGASLRACPAAARLRPGRLALAALCLLVGGARAQAQNWSDLRFQEFYGDLELRLELSDEDRATPTSSRSQKEILTREILTLGTIGYYYHPRLVEFDLRGSLGFEQQNISTDDATADQTNDASFPNWDLRALLFKEHGLAIRRERILDSVWGSDDFVGARAVDTHMVNLRHKIEANPKHPQHLLTVHGVGYRLVLEPDSGSA